MGDEGARNAGVTRRHALGAGAALGAVAIAGCGGDDQSKTTTTTSAAPQKQKKGGVLRVGVPSAANLSSWDPQFTPSATANNARSQNIYNLLATFDEDGKHQLVLAEEA